MKINQFRLSYTTIALTLSWLVALLGLIVYIQKLNQYFFVSKQIFIFPNFFWTFIHSLNLNINQSIRLMLWGTNLFTFLIVDFTLTYTGLFKKKYRKVGFFLLVSWFFLLIIIYDPSTYEIFYKSQFSIMSSRLDFEQFYILQKYLHYMTSLVNFLLLFSSIVIMIRFYYSNRKYAFFSRPLRLTVIALIIVVIVYLFVFSGFPYFLKTVAVLSNTIRYQRIDLGVFNFLFGYIPYLMILTLVFTFFIVFDQRRFVVENENRNLKILRDVSMAHSSSRIFTHSVKNQLVAILADTEILMEQLESQDKSYELAYSIKNSTLQTIQHLNDLRRFMDSSIVELKEVDFDDFVGSIDFKSLKSQSIEFKLELNSHTMCLVDKELLGEALMVILKNAVEAIGLNKGVIKISTVQVNKYVLLSICDSGSGIARDDLDKIFDPFFSTKPSRYNWGVGLTFSQKIVFAHHGRIEVESKLNSGTCFSIYLPNVD